LVALAMGGIAVISSSGRHYSDQVTGGGGFPATLFCFCNLLPINVRRGWEGVK